MSTKAYTTGVLLAGQIFLVRLNEWTSKLGKVTKEVILTILQPGRSVMAEVICPQELSSMYVLGQSFFEEVEVSLVGERIKYTLVRPEDRQAYNSISTFVDKKPKS